MLNKSYTIFLILDKGTNKRPGGSPSWVQPTTLYHFHHFHSNVIQQSIMSMSIPLFSARRKKEFLALPSYPCDPAGGNKLWKSTSSIRGFSFYFWNILILGPKNQNERKVGGIDFS
ncbi:unnamed protein product, partial [Amoebophrya sp. A120]|eukprot:GSA120T00026359001.1